MTSLDPIGSQILIAIGIYMLALALIALPTITQGKRG